MSSGPKELPVPQPHKDPRTELRMRIREIAQARVRYGYRKILALLNREDWKVGKYLVEQTYREEALTLRHEVNSLTGKGTKTHANQ